MFKNLAVWLVIGLVLMIVFNQFSQRSPSTKEMEYSKFIEEVNQGKVAKVTIEGKVLKGERHAGEPFTTYAPSDPSLLRDLLKSGVVVQAKPEEEPSRVVDIFVSWFPMLLLIGVWVYFMHRMQGGGQGGAIFSFGNSRAKMIEKSNNRKTFADMAGYARIWLATRRKKRKWPRLWSSCATRLSFRSSERAYRAVCCWSVVLEPGRPCSRRRLRARPTYPFSRFPARSS